MHFCQCFYWLDRNFWREGKPGTPLDTALIVGVEYRVSGSVTNKVLINMKREQKSNPHSVIFNVIHLFWFSGPKRLKNLTSIGCGIMVTYHFFGPLTWYLAANATISYLVLQVSTVVLNRGRGVLTAVTSVVFLFLW